MKISSRFVKICIADDSNSSIDVITFVQRGWATYFQSALPVSKDNNLKLRRFVRVPKVFKDASNSCIYTSYTLRRFNPTKVFSWLFQAAPSRLLFFLKHPAHSAVPCCARRLVRVVSATVLQTAKRDQRLQAKCGTIAPQAK